MKKLLFYIGLLLFTLTSGNAQKSSKINVDYSDFADINQTEIPDALLLSGHVCVSHEGEVFTRKLGGFVWRGDERIKSKEDIFPPEENEMDAKIQAEKKVEMAKENVPLEPSKETLDYDKNNPKPIVK